MKEMATEGSGEKPRTDYEKHLRYSQPNAEANQFEGHEDGPPTLGGKIERVRGRRKRTKKHNIFLLNIFFFFFLFVFFLGVRPPPPPPFFFFFFFFFFWKNLIL